ncbi:polysaccharide pyruvyl transferase family protein [Methanothermococcus sp. SCGC AD-155-C09]|nr:polysaccharide pyruvyl transferase family protein [Methanothermococcus sp. SCGC AD-155-C09]
MNNYNIIDAIRIFEFYKLTNILKTINFLTKSNLFIYGGKNLTNGNIPSMTLLGLAKFFGLPVISVGIGAIYPISTIIRFITKLLLNYVDVISVMDEKSRQ